MNPACVGLGSLALLSLRGRALSAGLPAVARCDSPLHRAVFQLCRTMASRHAASTPPPPPPKKVKQKDPLRRLRTKESRNKRGETPGPSTVFLQVVGAGTRGTTASLYAFSEYNRYLFNCGEGTQRLMQEHKLKVSQLDNIFLTQLSWQNVGGLSGMILTLRDTGVPECVLYGPPQLENYINAIKSFSGQLEDIKLSVRPYTAETYADDTMVVHQVPIFAKSSGNGSGLSPRSGRSSPPRSPASPRRDDILANSDDENPGSPSEKRKVARDSSMVVSFICRLHPKRGNFLVAEAKELGLPVGTAAIGPLITALKAGKSVIHEGREIRPEQVCTPTDPGPIFIITECPSEEFIDPFCSNPQLRRYQTGGTEDPPALVVHMTPESVLETDQYKKWMERFPSTTEHLIMNEQACSVHNISSHKIQTQLNMIHPQIFPQLKSFKTKELQAALHVPSVRAECLLKFQLRPVMEWQRDAIPSCNTEEFVKEAFEVPNFVEEVDKCRQICSTDTTELSGQEKKYPEMVFLGTGSALPMKIRNVSGTLVNISPSQAILLDCGEGTFGQLCRQYGDGVDEVLSRISTVFISHMHADHHTGLIKVLYERETALITLGKAFTPIYLVGPHNIMNWLKRYHSCEEILSHISFVANKFLCDGGEVPNQRTKSFIQALLKKNDLEQFQTCTVHHCNNAYACSFVHQSGWKLAFSGDTMPCDAFVRIGKNANLVIHEATLEDQLEGEAIEKRHSTTSQAIGVGVKMNAGFIMLNHFSQRYAKIPLFNEDFSDRVGISFDHMRICLGDLKVLPRLIPALKTLFAEEIGEMEERREKRELKHLRGGGPDANAEQKTGKAGRGAKRDQKEAATCSAETKRLKTS